MNKDCWLLSKYIAHRGLHNDSAPENSLLAFQNAVDAGYTIELDVHQLADGTLAVFHDDQLSRVTGRDGYITLLKKEDLSSYHLFGSEQHIPTLQEVLDLVAGKAPILIEIKNTGKVGVLEAELLKQLSNYKGEVAIQAFNPYVLEWFLFNAPEIPRGQLASFFRGEKISFIKKFILRRLGFVKKVKADFISYDFHELPNRFVNRHKNLPVIAWTIRTQEDYEQANKFCDNIIFENFTPQTIKD